MLNLMVNRMSGIVAVRGGVLNDGRDRNLRRDRVRKWYTADDQRDRQNPSQNVPTH